MCPPDPPKRIAPPDPTEPAESAQLELEDQSPAEARRRTRKTGATAILTTPLSIPSLPSSGGAVTGGQVGPARI